MAGKPISNKTSDKESILPVSSEAPSGALTTPLLQNLHSEGISYTPSSDSENEVQSPKQHISVVSSNNPNDFLGSDSDQEDRDVGKSTIFWEEVKIILRFALSSLWAQLAERSIITVPILFVGHLSTSELAGISMGRLTAAVTGLSILEGLSGALDTLLPSVWKSPKPKLMGLWSQRMVVVLAISLLPIFAIWFNAESILLALNQDPEVAYWASAYLRWFSLGLPAYAFNLVVRRYLQAQERYNLYSGIAICIAPLNLILTYLLVHGPAPVRLGFIGAPIATATSYTLMSILSIIVSIYYAPRRGWHPISYDMFTNLGMIIRLGLSSIGQIAPEWWAWEIMSWLTSFLSPPDIALASQVVLTNTSAVLYQVGACSVNNGASNRVGNLIGGRKPKRAAIAAIVSIVLSCGAGLITCTNLLIFREWWPYMFTNDKVVAKAVTEVLPIIALYQIGEAISFLTGAILRVKGDQLLGAVVIVSAYYVIGLPIGTILAFPLSLGLQGLWTGLAIALFCSAGVGTYLCSTTDWYLEVKKVEQRTEAEGKWLEGIMVRDEERCLS